jgi:N6-L-threonylcarbamoyladenine synthase
MKIVLTNSPGPPLAESKGGEKTSKRMAYSFAGLLTSVERFMTRELDTNGQSTKEARSPEDINVQERQEMAREIQRVTFEHLTSRILLYLGSQPTKPVKTIVVSGGVASNSYLRHVMRAMLDIRGYSHIQLEFPPVNLATDNALMIAWAALEMWNAGYRSSLDIKPIRTWSMDPTASDGGILGVGGWCWGETRK